MLNDPMRLLAAVFALLVAAAGWFYMFYSRAADHLADVEGQHINLRRQRLRRVGGLTMMLLAICFFAGAYTIDPQQSPQTFLLVWFAVFVLLMLVVILALVDVKLTWNLRRTKRKPPR